MSYVVESHDADGRRLLGSDGTLLAYDLTTLRGVFTRALRKPWHPLAATLNVYRWPYEHRYNARMSTYLCTWPVPGVRARPLHNTPLQTRHR